MLALFREQPRAFSMIFMLEIWERFGYYTVQGVLTLYFIRFLGLDDNQAYLTFGAFSALVYGMVAIGGYLGDNVLGTKRTILIGLISLTLGYLALALADKNTVYWALGLVCVGNGLFKANPSNLLAKCYEPNDQRLHGAFTLYYMAINLGSTVSLFLGPALASHYGYFYAYFLSFIGLLLGLANYYFQRQSIKDIHTAADDRPIKFWQWTVIAIGIVLSSGASSLLLQYALIARQLVWIITAGVVIIYFFYMVKQEKIVFWRMAVAFILMLEGTVFFTLYQQMPTSLNLFAVNNVIPTLLGISINAQSFQALNPVWILILSPLLALIYKRLNGRNIAFTLPYKFAVGMFFCALSFGLLFFSRYAHDDQGMVSSLWLIASYFFQSTGELFVSALGVAMVAELVPASITGFVMGMWFLTSSVAGFLGASVASYTALPSSVAPGIHSLIIYTNTFGWIGLITFVISLLMWASSAKLSQLI